MSSNRAKPLAKLLKEIDAAEPGKHINIIKLNLAKIWGKIEASQVYSVDNLYFHLECYFHILSRYAAELDMLPADIIKKKIHIYASIGQFFSSSRDYQNAIPFYTNAILLIDSGQVGSNIIYKLGLFNLRLYSYIKLKDLLNAVKDAAFIDQTLIDRGVYTESTAHTYTEWADSSAMNFRDPIYTTIMSDLSNNLGVLFRENIKSDIGEIISLSNSDYHVPEGGLIVSHYNKTGFLEDAVYFVTKSVNTALADSATTGNDPQKFEIAIKKSTEHFDQKFGEIQCETDIHEMCLKLKSLLTHLMSSMNMGKLHVDPYAFSVIKKIAYLVKKYENVIDQYDLLSAFDRVVVTCRLARLYQVKAQYDDALSCYEKAEAFIKTHHQSLDEYAMLRLFTMKLSMLFESKHIAQVINMSVRIDALIEELELTDQWEEVVLANSDDQPSDATALIDMSDLSSYAAFALGVIRHNLLQFFKLIPKEAVFQAITEIEDVALKRKILNKIVRGDGILSLGFWQQRGDNKCKIESGTLKKIVDYLAELDGQSNNLSDNVGEILGSILSIFARKPQTPSSSMTIRPNTSSL